MNFKDDRVLTPEEEQEQAKLKLAIEKALLHKSVNTDWQRHFDDRQLQLINNCRLYARNDPAGLPGHNLMIIINAMAGLLDNRE